MKNILISKVWPVFAALLAASIVMMVFEFTNSYIYPIPSDLDWTNRDAVAALTKSLPWTAYILVLSGWITGSFMGGLVAAYLSKERSHTLPFVTGAILAVLGLLNNMMLGHGLLFNVATLPIFVVCAYMGYRYLLRARGNTVLEPHVT